MIDYFIAYTSDGVRGNAVSNCSVRRFAPITSMDSIAEISDKIRKEFDLKHVVITNWRRFEPVE